MDYMNDSEPMGDDSSAQGAMDEKSDSGKTALVDSSICPGMKPGDTFTVKVEKVLDSGEYVLSYPEGENKESEAPMGEAPPESSDMAYMS